MGSTPVLGILLRPTGTSCPWFPLSRQIAMESVTLPSGLILGHGTTSVSRGDPAVGDCCPLGIETLMSALFPVRLCQEQPGCIFLNGFFHCNRMGLLDHRAMPAAVSGPQETQEPFPPFSHSLPQCLPARLRVPKSGLHQLCLGFSRI